MLQIIIIFGTCAFFAAFASDFPEADQRLMERQTQRRKLQIPSVGNKENPLSLLWHAHSGRVKIKYLKIVSDRSEACYDLVYISFGFPLYKALDVFCDNNFWSKPICHIYKCKEQVIQPLFFLAFPESLFNAPCFFTHPYS